MIHILTRQSLRAIACATLALLLASCFVSDSLFERERIWDPAWFGRYEAEGVMFVVLPDDPAKHTYLIGEFDGEASKVDTYRAALYRGWNEVLILGHLTLGKSDTQAGYTLLRPLGANRFLSKWPDCNPEFAEHHRLTRDRDLCTFASLETLRAALKAYADENQKPATEDPKPLEHRRDHPLSTIGVTAQAGVFSDSEGVHGGLNLIDVPPTSPAAKAGLKKGDQIFAIGGPRPAIGEELLLRIAAATPGTTIAVTFFDGKTHAKREVGVVTAPLE